MAAKSDIGARIGLDGAQKFKDDLKLVNGNLKVLNTALKELDTQSGNSAVEAENLRRKEEMLAKAIEVNQQKVALLTEELEKETKAQAEQKSALDALKTSQTATTGEIEKAESAYINQASKVDRLATNLNLAKAELNNTNKAFEDNSAAIRDWGAKWEATGDKIAATGGKIESAGKKLSIASAAVVAVGVGSVKTAINFESAFAGVEKTVDGTAEQLDSLRQGIIDMSQEIPASTTEIAAVAEAAGQLAIETDNVMGFTRVMIDLGNAAADLDAETAAMELAQFANITEMAQKDFDRLGSSITWLGNNTATTEGSIVSMAGRLAGAGKQANMTEPQILGIAAGLSSLGIEAQAGGTAFSKVIKEMITDVELGKGNIENFASVAGLSVEEFSALFREDAAAALTQFIIGLGDTENMGQSTIAMLEEMGLTEIRVSDALLRTSGASDILVDAIEGSEKAWEDNNALTQEAAKRYETTASKASIVKNRLVEQGRQIGEKLLPVFGTLLDYVEDAVNWFNNLDDGAKNAMIGVGGFIAIAGPATTLLGKLTSGAGSVVSGVGSMVSRFKDASAAGEGLVGSVGKMIGPGGIFAIAVTGVTLLGVAIYNEFIRPTQEATAHMDRYAEGLAAFSTKLHNTQADLSVYASAFSQVDAAQAEAKTSLEAAQSGMTEILRREKEERDGLTQEDIANLTEYYQQMTQANETVLNLEQEKMNQMMALYKQELAGQEYSNAAYAELAAQRLADSQAQADMVLTMLEEQYIAELAANDTWFKTLDAQQQAQNQAEYDANIAAIQTRYADEKAETQAGLADVYEMYAAGYNNRLWQDVDFREKHGDFMSQALAQEEAYRARVAEIQAKLTGEAFLNAGQRAGYMKDEIDSKYEHYDVMLDLWNQYNDSMTDAQREQVENMISFALETEMQGGVLNDSTRAMVDSIITAWNMMPDGTKDTMKNTVQGMLDGLAAEEGVLYAQMAAAGDNTLAALREALGVHSPSWKAAEAFDYVMQGAIQGLENRRADLLGKAQGIAGSVISTIKAAFDINSPSKVMEKLFGYVGQGAVIGLHEQIRKVAKESYNMGEEAVEAMFEASRNAKVDTSALAGLGRIAEAQRREFSKMLTWQAENNAKMVHLSNKIEINNYQNRDENAIIRSINRALGRAYR